VDLDVLKRRTRRLAELAGVLGGQHGDLRDVLDRLIINSGGAADTLGIVGARHVDRLASARLTADLLGDVERVAARPAPEEDLAVMEWALRPAVPVIDGRVAAAAADLWPLLGDLDLSAVVSRVCRIDAGQTSDGRVQVGTGVFVRHGSETVLVTAAHVLSNLESCGWRQTLEAWAVRGENPATVGSEALPLREVVGVHERHDLASLRVEDVEQAASFSSPVANIPPDCVVVVVGYPYFDSRRDAWPRDFGFREPAGVLRVAPGACLGTAIRRWAGHDATVITHDAPRCRAARGRR
jgi:hypothetical protein